MIARIMMGMLCATAFFAISVGDGAQAARKAPRCMEAVMPKCGAGKMALCAKQSKCKSCAKWACTTQKKLLPFLM